MEVWLQLLHRLLRPGVLVTVKSLFGSVAGIPASVHPPVDNIYTQWQVSEFSLGQKGLPSSLWKSRLVLLSPLLSVCVTIKGWVSPHPR